LRELMQQHHRHGEHLGLNSRRPAAA
jgi:hypothetical protein